MNTSIHMITVILGLCVVLSYKNIKWSNAEITGVIREVVFYLFEYGYAYYCCVLANSITHSLMGLFLPMFYLMLNIKLIRDMYRDSINEHYYKYAIILCINWYGLLMITSSINYVLLSSYPNLFEYMNGFTGWRKAFECVYYTFTLMFRYGSDVVVNKTNTEIVQIIEITLFYVVVGTMITQIISRIVMVASEKAENDRLN